MMEKILFLVDALNFKTDSLDFAAYISRLNKSKLVGVFVENQLMDSFPAVKNIGGTVYVEEITADPGEEKQHAELVQKNINAFMSACTQREVLCATHYDKGQPAEKIIEETRYADLLIVDPSFSFEEDGKVPSKFVIELLNKAECPVIVAPEYFEQVDEIVMAYDGSRSSVFAIKQFYYQLPKLAEKRIVVLHINKENVSVDRNDTAHLQFREWLDMHFAKVSFLELKGEARDILFGYFMVHGEQCNQMLVTGSFGRNYLSTFFKPSTAELVLKAVDIPIFISHH
jgi:hypothetical protein